MVKKYFFLFCLTSFTLAHANTSIYFGKNDKELIFVHIHDSIAAIEVCRFDQPREPRTYIDTLYFQNDRFTKGIAQIVRQDKHLLFLPDHIFLYPTNSDTAYSSIRKEGYLKGFASLLALKYLWVNPNNWVKMNHLLSKETSTISANLPNALYYKAIQRKANFFENIIVPQYAEQFHRIVITDNTFLSNYRYVDTTEPLVIQQIWNALIDNEMIFKKFSIWKILPYPVIYVGLGILNPIFYFVVPPAVAIWTLLTQYGPSFVSHIDKNKAFIIHFYSKNGSVLKVKVKNNTIFYHNHYYALASNFQSLLGEIQVAMNPSNTLNLPTSQSVNDTSMK
ncbi:MAG: hypothetical protein ACP5F6_03060 [Microbacter sp.]